MRYNPTVCPALLLLGNPYTKAVPINGNKVDKLTATHRRLRHLDASQLKKHPAIVDMTPVGIVNKADVCEVYPNS
jgi:hypothetical protein